MYMYIHCTFRAAFKIELRGGGGGGGAKLVFCKQRGAREFCCAKNAISQDLKWG